MTAPQPPPRPDLLRKVFLRSIQQFLPSSLPLLRGISSGGCLRPNGAVHAPILPFHSLGAIFCFARYYRWHPQDARVLPGRIHSERVAFTHRCRPKLQENGRLQWSVEAVDWGTSD